MENKPVQRSCPTCSTTIWIPLLLWELIVIAFQSGGFRKSFFQMTPCAANSICAFQGGGSENTFSTQHHVPQIAFVLFKGGGSENTFSKQHHVPQIAFVLFKMGGGGSETPFSN